MLYRQDRWGNVPLDDAKMAGKPWTVMFLLRKHKECGLKPFDQNAQSNGQESAAAPPLRRSRSQAQESNGASDKVPEKVDVLVDAETKLNSLTLPDAEPATVNGNGTTPSSSED